MIRRGFIWQYPALVDDVRDGDSTYFHVDFGPQDIQQAHRVLVRAEGINAIELNAKFGGEARDRAAEFLKIGTPVTLISHKTEKFGRMLAKIVTLDNQDFSTWMLVQKASDGTTPLAVPYLT